MNKVIKLIRAMACVTALFTLPTIRLQAECNENQAFNKMMAFNQAWMKYQQGYMARAQKNPDEHQKFRSGAERSGALGAKLANKEWDAVCAGYDALAKEYGFNLTKSAEGMLTIEQLKKDGGKGQGRCSLEDAAKRYMQMEQKFQDRNANGEVTLEVARAFRADTEPIGLEMNKNPSAVCDKVDTLSKKYGLVK